MSKPTKKTKTPIPVQKSETDIKGSWYKKQGLNTQNRRQRQITSDFYRQLEKVGRGL